MERRYYHGAEEHRVALGASGAEPRYRVDGDPVEAQVRPGPEESLLVRLGGRTFHVLLGEGRAHTEACVDGHLFRLEHRPPRTSGRGKGEGPGRFDGRLSSPMTGTVRRVLAAEGDRVEPGRPLVLVEAMKMEFAVRSPEGGTVRRVHRGEGDRVEMGDALLEIETDEGGGP